MNYPVNQFIVECRVQDASRTITLDNANQNEMTELVASVNGKEEIRIELWDNMSKTHKEKLKKNTVIIVQGYLKSSNWKDQNGEAKSKVILRARNISYLEVDSKTISRFSEHEIPFN